MHHAVGDTPSVPHLEAYIAHLWNSNLPTTYSLIRDLERAYIALDTARWRLACDSWRWRSTCSAPYAPDSAAFWWLMHRAILARRFWAEHDPEYDYQPGRVLALRTPGMVA